MSLKDHKLVIVSNRLPLSLKIDKSEMQITPSSGGLVSALEPILAQLGGIWIGNPGLTTSSEEENERVRKLLAESARDLPYRYLPVFLTREEQINFYEGFSNEVVWPLFHDLQTRCKFAPVYWEAYKRVNRKFAQATYKAVKPGDLIWIQDYQLMDVARVLRTKLPQTKLAFFLHIPFPAPDIFAKLPWRQAILESLLEHDLLGFQTRRDRFNFLACLRTFVKEAEIEGDGHSRTVTYRNRRTEVQFFPISIDYEQFATDSAQPPVATRAEEIRNHLGDRHLALGVDRLDYTKGLPERMRAFATLLREYPDLRGKISLYQVVIPSRETIVGYKKLMAEIERLVAHINGEYSQPGWVPIHYVHRSVPREELLALYRAANTALVTPLKDGMNLVAKEYCAARTDEDGVLILSEFAGAAPELQHGALLVNPYDELGVAAALAQSFSMGAPERHRRMVRLRIQIRRCDIMRWRDDFFAALESQSDATG